MNVLYAMYMVIGVLFIALGIPLAARRVPPNGLYGYRVPATVNDPKVWYPVNETCGRWMVATGLATIAATWGFERAGLMKDAYALSVTGVMLLGVALMAIFSTITLYSVRK